MKFFCALLLHMEFIIYVYFYLFFLNTPLSLEINSLHVIFFFNANQYFLIFKFLLQMKSIKKKAVERNYDCVICMDLCKKPISCLRCHQLICYHHVKLLADKCPHCRLEPFQYQDEPMIQSYIHIQITKKREALKKEHVFKCLVEQCNFQGKYPTMVFHKKSKHPYQKIDQILFPEERQKKKMREAIKRIFLQKYVDKAKKYTEQALVFYIKGKGVVGMKQLTKMVAHINNCNHEQCKTVIYAQNYASIGIKYEDQVIESDCPYVNQFRVDI